MSEPKTTTGTARSGVPLKRLVLQFVAYHPGEYGAGIRHYRDEIEVSVASGDPGGDPGEFAEHIRQSLAEWFDGAKVSVMENAELRNRARKENYE